MNYDQLKSKDFDPELTVYSPGRINLIGEHTDYNMGFVLPAAIDKRIVFKIKRNGSNEKCHVYSTDYDKIVAFDLNNVKPSQEEWENYILGVVFEIQKLGYELSGFDCQLDSNLPIGSGISSSAALECGLAFALNSLFQLGMSKLDIVHASQRAEHNFVGTQCGIMDQYASVMSEPGHVILLDCKTVTHKFVPLHLKPYCLLLLNTNVTHSLANSAYNTRKSECETGVAILKQNGLKTESLREVTIQDLTENATDLPPIVFKRCRNIVEENQRVLKAADSLQKNDLEEFGKLLYESHRGQQLEYEISCEELDFLVDFSIDQPQVLGSRMMGGGFGGCTINLIHEDHVDDYVEKASKAYRDRFDIDLTPVYITPSGGTFIV